MPRLAHVFLLLAWFLASGGQWAFMQGFAWSGMIVTYTGQSGNIATGLARTFDGAHPCRFCKAIAAARQSAPAEQDSPLRLLEQLPRHYPAPEPFALAALWPAPAPAPRFAAPAPLRPRADAPPLRPPRSPVRAA